MAKTFLNCESTYDFTDVTPSIYDRKIAARPFGTIHGIQRCLSAFLLSMRPYRELYRDTLQEHQKIWRFAWKVKGVLRPKGIHLKSPQYFQDYYQA